MEAKNKNNRHVHNNKIRILRLLEKNNFNYLKTQRQTGVSRQSLRRWVNRYGYEVYNKGNPTLEALSIIDAEMKNNDINIIRSLYVLRKLALQKILKMAEAETKIDPLLNILKYTSAELQKFSDLEKQVPNPIQDTMSFIRLINDQIASQEKSEDE